MSKFKVMMYNSYYFHVMGKHIYYYSYRHNHFELVFMVYLFKPVVLSFFLLI